MFVYNSFINSWQDLDTTRLFFTEDINELKGMKTIECYSMMK